MTDRGLKAQEERQILAEMIERVRAREKVADEDRRIGAQFFIIAKSDLEACRILHSHELWALSAYHLQQCYEKLVKAFFILTGTTNPETVNGHDYVKNKLSKLLEEDWFKFGLGVYKYVNEAELDVKPEIAKLATTDSKEIKKLSSETFRKLIEVFAHIENKLLSKEAIDTAYNKAIERKHVEKVRHVISQFIRRRLSDATIQKEITKEKIVESTENSVLAMKLMFFGLLTMYHANEPRYPIGPKGKEFDLNFFNYTPELGIVETTPELINLAQNIVTAFERKYSEEIALLQQNPISHSQTKQV